MAASVTVLAFAGARDILGVDQLEVELSGPMCAEQLLEEVCQRFPDLCGYRGALKLAINGHYAKPQQPLCAGDEVALIPPVAGG